MSFIPLPSPPTESLHKFKALSGLLLIIAALFYCLNQANDTNRLTLATEKDIDVLEAKIDFEQQEFLVLKKAEWRDSINQARVLNRMDKLLLKLKSSDLEYSRAKDAQADIDRDIDEVDKAAKETAQVQEKSRRSSRDIKILLAEVRNKNKLAGYNILVFYCYLGILFFASWFGSTIAYQGFRDWSKLQAAQDAEVLKVLSAEAEPAPEPAAH